MEPVLIENNHDCTVSLQIIIPTRDGVTSLPREIALMIEGRQGEHIATFTPQQASDLIDNLKLMITLAAGSKAAKSIKNSLLVPENNIIHKKNKKKLR